MTVESAGYAFCTFKYTILKETSDGLLYCRLDDPHQAEEFFMGRSDRYLRIGVTEFVQKKPSSLCNFVKKSQDLKEG